MNLMSKACIIFLLFSLSCQNKKVEPSFETMNEGELINKHFFFSLPYQNSSDSAAVISVTINGKKRRFMIDTGAPLVISKSLQEEIKFPVLMNTTTRDSNGDTTGVVIVKIPELFIGGLGFKNIPALILDFGLPVFSCDTIDGLIGSNLLRLLVIQFNKPEQKIYFADHIDSLKLAANTTSLNMSLNFEQSDPVIGIKLNNETMDSSLYDSGDKVLYTISKKRFDRLNKQRKFDNEIVATGTGVGGQGIVAKNTDSLPSFTIRFDSLSVGSQSIKNIYTEPNYDTRSRMGRGLWNYGLVTMDYTQKRFYFTPYKADLEVADPLHFGFKYQERNGKLVATVVWENTQAAGCGLKPGFEIIQFGNFIPTSVSKCEWSAICRKEAQAKNITIKYLDGKGETKTCSLQQTKFQSLNKSL
jgi:predicted aspartyl protease